MHADRLSALAACLIGLVVACAGGEDTTKNEPKTGHRVAYASCQEIIDACHPLDVGDPGTIHDCHEIGTGPEQGCLDKRAECLATCVPPDGGAR